VSRGIRRFEVRRVPATAAAGFLGRNCVSATIGAADGTVVPMPAAASSGAVVKLGVAVDLAGDGTGQP
jgi:hypothetical protein